MWGALLRSLLGGIRNNKTKARQRQIRERINNPAPSTRSP